MRLRNSTEIPNALIKEIVRFARPPGISKFKVAIGHRKHGYWNGHGCSSSILVCLNTKARYPKRLWTYQLGQLRGRRYYLATLTEALVYLIAHELMHTKQGQFGRIYGRRGRKVGRVRGRIWGARGKYSEIETESYAIRKLREWRRTH